MELKDIQAGFTRARRFLFAVSLALALTKALAIPFTKINLLGNEAEIPHPEQVGWLFWIAWAWALAQYLVWLKDVGAWREFRSAVDDACGKHLGEAAALEPIPEWLVKDLNKQLLDKLAGSRALLTSKEVVKFHQRFTQLDGDGKKKPRVANVMADAYVRLKDRRGEALAGETRYEVEIPEDVWRQRNWRETIIVLIFSRFTLEYFAPFAIALLPVGVAIYRHYHPAA
jgi:hypothetical protein